MKFVSASFIHLGFAAATILGIILFASGKPALLIGCAAVYAVVLAKVGCAAH